MKRIIYMLIVHLMVIPLFSQSLERQVIASGGSYMQASGIELSSTIGEPVDDNVISGTLKLTQGFQQADSMSLLSDEDLYITVDYKVYPNPVKDYINLEYQTQKELDVQVLLLNTKGQVLVSKETSLSVSENRMKIDVKSLPHGIYYLVFRQDDGGVTESIAIEKIQ